MLIPVYGLGEGAGVNALHGPVHVRIFVDDDSPILHELPWRAAAYRGRSLSLNGWRFTMAPGLSPRDAVGLPHPPRILLVAPAPTGLQALETELHLQSLRSVTGRASPHYADSRHLRLATTWTQVQRVIADGTPDILYYYGHGEVRGGQACLLLEPEPGGDQRPEAVPFASLRSVFGGRWPSVAFVNACWSGGGALSSAGHQLCPEVPLVIANRTRAWSEAMARGAERWFARVLLDEDDPVTACHEVSPSDNLRSFEWATRSVHAACRRMDVTAASIIRRVPAHEALDRLQIRTRIGGEVHAMAPSQSPRVLSVVVHGSRENHPRHFGALLGNHLESLDSTIWRTRPVVVGSEVAAAALGSREAFERAILEAAGNPEASLTRAIETLARPRSGGARILLYLDWGALRGDTAQAVLPVIQAFSDLGLRSLTRECPRTVQVLSVVSVELPASEHAALQGALEELAEDSDTREHAFHHPEPLPIVRRDELSKYLHQREQSGCDPEHVREACAALLQDTGGRYDALCERLDELYREGWPRLKRRLRA